MMFNGLPGRPLLIKYVEKVDMYIYCNTNNKLSGSAIQNATKFFYARVNARNLAFQMAINPPVTINHPNYMIF